MQEIENDLLVACPVSAISEYKDGLDFDLAIIPRSWMFKIFFHQFSEERCVGIIFDDVSWRNNILEAIILGNSSALFAFAAHYEDCFVSFCHFSPRCVSADELTGRDFNAKLRGQLSSFFFGLTTAVYDKNVRSSKCEEVFEDEIQALNTYLHLDVVFVRPVEHLHRVLGFRYDFSFDEHAVNIKGESVDICDFQAALFRCHDTCRSVRD